VPATLEVAVNTVWTRLSRSLTAALALVGMATACSSSKQASPPAGAGSTQSGALESNPAGDIPDNQAFVAFRDSAGRFTVEVPEGWAQTSDAGTVVFSDKYNSIRIQTQGASTAPTTSSVSSSDLPAIAASASGYTGGSVSMVNRKAGPVILARYRANSPTNPVTGRYAVEAVERYVFYRAGHEVILTLAAPVGSDNVDPWRKVTDSFGWL
jgi:hypothetical protein